MELDGDTENELLCRVEYDLFQHLILFPTIFTHIQMLLYQRHQLRDILSLRREFGKLIEHGKHLITGHFNILRVGQHGEDFLHPLGFIRLHFTLWGNGFTFI